jgi:hypothetical protein
MMGIKACPLCDSEGPEDSPELIQHILQHVHDFSLRSLPWPADPVISLGNPAGTFDLDYAAKVSSNNEGTEYNLDIAEWAESTDHRYGATIKDDEAVSDLVALEQEAAPSLQLCNFDMNPPRPREEERTVPPIHVDYFSQHNYFKETSSDASFSSQSLRSSVKFYFRIDEFTEHPEAIEQFDKNGRWCPVAISGYNIRIDGGISGQWYHCDGESIHHVSNWRPAGGEAPYKTFSMIYSDGHGLHVLRGDATNPLQSETWQDLSFDWDETTLSSTLTNAGARRSLRVHNPNARWPRMLLPDIYHGPEYPGSHYGGLTGDLPIFLALVALSMRPERLAAQLPRMMEDGEWIEHERSHGRELNSSCTPDSTQLTSYRHQQARRDCLRLRVPRER